MTPQLNDIADEIERRAAGATRTARSGQKPLCRDMFGHDDRWCDICAGMEDGMFFAAEMVRRYADESGVRGSSTAEKPRRWELP